MHPTFLQLVIDDIIAEQQNEQTEKEEINEEQKIEEDDINEEESIEEKLDSKQIEKNEIEEQNNIEEKSNLGEIVVKKQEGANPEREGEIYEKIENNKLLEGNE